MSLLQKQSNPVTTAINNAGSGHDSADPLEELQKLAREPLHEAIPPQKLSVRGSKDDLSAIAAFLENEGFKHREELGGGDSHFFDLSYYTVQVWDKSPSSTSAISRPLVPTYNKSTAKWWVFRNRKRLKYGEGLSQLQNLLSQQPDLAVDANVKWWIISKQVREPLHDDSGALTGLRSRPDYGESDSHTTQMNEANGEGAKGVVAGYNIAVETPTKIASGDEMYISAVEFNPKDALTVEKFSFTADHAKAMTFHRLTANDIAEQISSPVFGARARVILAASYDEMFKALINVMPDLAGAINQEIIWAKTHLKKQDRITWYLRLYRLALVDQSKYNAQFDIKEKTEMETLRTELDGLAESEDQGYQPKEPDRTRFNLLKRLKTKYQNEFSAKGGNPEENLHLDQFPEMKRNLEHFYGIPVPEIQNKILTVESWPTIKNLFSTAERAWQEQAKKLIRTKPEDKIWMQFPDGWAWWWLPRAACDDESKAMGHCGNAPMAGTAGVSILSLREPKKVGNQTMWEPHATFILHGEGDTGSLGEMKGRNNAKPVARYHPYIIALLKDPRILSIVGRGYLPENNFALSDLTVEQQKEIADVNPSIGLSLSAYYSEFGMDDKLASRIKTLLDLEGEARHERNYGFIIRSWPTQKDFIEDCGDRDAIKAQKFIETGISPIDDPDEDDMLKLMDGMDDQTIYHIGLALQYHYATEIDRWFDDPKDFDPKNPEQIKALFKDIYTFKVLPTKRKDKTTSAYRIPVISEFFDAYHAGDPDQYQVREIMNYHVDMARENLQDSFMEFDPKGIYQVISEEDAIKEAQSVENGGHYSAPRQPNIYFDSAWDEWNEDTAKEALADEFADPPKRPKVKQRNLPYKGKGRKITKLLSPLFKSATAKPRRENIAGAPFKIGMDVKYMNAEDAEEAEELDMTKYLGQTGVVEYYEYDCGCGQSFPGDPMIGVRFHDGQLHEFWKNELQSASQNP